MVVLVILILLGSLTAMYHLLEFILRGRTGLGARLAVTTIGLALCGAAWYVTSRLPTRDAGPKPPVAGTSLAKLDDKYTERRWTRSLQKQYLVTYVFAVNGKEHRGQSVLKDPPEHFMEVLYDPDNPERNVLTAGSLPWSYTTSISIWISLGLSVAVALFGWNSIARRKPRELSSDSKPI